MWRFPARFVGPYAEQDAIAELLLAHDLRPTLHKEKTWNAYRLEMDLMPVTHEMRRRGIRIDVGYAHQVKADLIAKRDAVLVELSDLLAMPMTITECRSPKFLEKAFDLQHIDYPRTPKTRQGSFTSDWMRDHEHWLPRLVSRAEQFESAGNKFVQGYLIDYAVGGRLHATVNQFRGEEGGTKSHRFSYSDPPLQQMPARDEEFATPIRGIFQPEPGEVWLSADYSQQEYRLIVHYAEMSKLPRAKQAGDKYRDNPDTDFHSMVVDWTGLDRRSAKNANFAKSYGAGIKKFAKMIEQDEEEARRLYNKYDRELPFVTQLAMRCQRLAEGRGYIKLCDGARSHFDLWEPKHFGESSWGARPKDKAIAAWGLTNIRRYDCRKAMNRLIQGSAARQTKAAIRACARAGYIPMLQMHDELCFSITSQKQADEITELMREAAKMYIPSKVDAEFGPNWGAAKHKDFVMSPIPKAAPAPKQEKKPRKIKQKVEHPFIILTPDQEAYAEEIARKRTTFARKIGRKHTNTPVQFSDEHAFKLDRESCPSELACSLMLGEDAKWVAYTEGSVSGLPEITWRGLSIDVKAIQKSHHKLIVKKNDPVGWIFVLALREGSKHTMLGWVSGERAKQAEFWDDPVGGRAAFFAPQSVLLPFSLLLETVDPNV
jgi:DNA polymerase I-like protein with 3'-5' exonuclease and polymerase domains